MATKAATEIPEIPLRIEKMGRPEKAPNYEYPGEPIRGRAA